MTGTEKIDSSEGDKRKSKKANSRAKKRVLREKTVEKRMRCGGGKDLNEPQVYTRMFQGGETRLSQRKRNGLYQNSRRHRHERREGGGQRRRENARSEGYDRSNDAQSDISKDVQRREVHLIKGRRKRKRRTDLKPGTFAPRSAERQSLRLFNFPPRGESREGSSNLEKKKRKGPPLGGG